MAEKSLRQLIDEMTHLEQGDQKVYYPALRISTKTISSQAEWVKEGTIGSVIGGGIGGGLGALAGGGLGAVAGGALGAYAGDKIGDWLDPSTKTAATGTSPGGSYVSAEPAAGGGGLGGAPSGGGSSYSTVNGKHTDSMGNTKQDYTPMPGAKPLVGQLSLKTASTDGDFSRLLSRLDGFTVAQSWQFNGALIALAFKDEADPTTADDQGNLGIWVDLAEFSKGALLTGGGKEEIENFKKLGFKLQGSTTGTTHTSLGGAVVYSYKLSSGVLSKDIGLFEINALYAFKYQGKNGLCQVQGTFSGPMKVWADGGQDQLDRLMNTLEPAPGFESLSPLNGNKKPAEPTAKPTAPEPSGNA